MKTRVEAIKIPPLSSQAVESRHSQMESRICHDLKCPGVPSLGEGPLKEVFCVGDDAECGAQVDEEENV